MEGFLEEALENSGEVSEEVHGRSFQSFWA